MKIALSSDHAGWEKENKLVMKHLDEIGIEYKDFGAYSSESSDYARIGLIQWLLLWKR